MTNTTIRLPTELRERVQQHARQERVSQATVVERALDLLDRETFFDRLRRDVSEHPEDSADRDEREAWLAGPLVVDSADQ